MQIKLGSNSYLQSESELLVEWELIQFVYCIKFNCYALYVSLYKCLVKKNKRFSVAVTAIEVIAAVSATVLLVVGIILSTQNGQYVHACLSICSHVVALQICSENLF